MRPVYVKYLIWGICEDRKEQDSYLSGSSALLLKDNWWSRNDNPIGIKYCITDKTFIIGGRLKDAGVIEHVLFTYFEITREVIHTNMKDVSHNKVKVKLTLDKVDFYQCIEQIRANGLNIQKTYTFGRLFR